MNSPIKIKAQIERITYNNEENGYTVARVKIFGERRLITVVGSIVSPTPGEVIEMEGNWDNHPQYGEQFRIKACKTSVPATVYGIKKYLGSGLIKGIGPVMAERIVKKFKENTLEIIEKNIENLTQIEGIAAKRIKMIQKAWDEQKDIRDLMIFLQSHGVSSGYAVKIFKRYGNAAINIVKENPYRLASDIFGIGFVIADSIAEKLGIAKDSEIRATAGILYVLGKTAEEGNVYYPYSLLLEKCKSILDISTDNIIFALGNLTLSKQVIVEDINEDKEWTENNKAVYLAKYHVCETASAFRIKNLIHSQKSLPEIDADKAIERIQSRLNIKLAEKQKEAVKSAFQNKVLVITGGPGTGKTTIINSIIKIFLQESVKILLAAPTGRAAKRMSETTGYPASTIHRLLDFNMADKKFRHNLQNPLKCDLLIIDEASMIDVLLMHHLLKAAPQNAVFILVGDINQLPSVGAGNVLKDIIDSGAVSVVELKEIFRQAQQSSIIVNAHRINQGLSPFYANDSPDTDFYFIEKEDPEEVLKIIVDLASNRITKRFGFDPIEDIQVLTPMHKGVVGAENLNKELRRVLNPNKSEISVGFKTFAEQDKVMQITNNYDKKVYNGDIGRIIRINKEDQKALIRFDAKDIEFSFSDLDEITHAYAVSVHKSQGSEYPAVIIPILTQHYILLQRNLLYTAITRGKKLVTIVGSKKAMAIGINNDKVKKRYTLFKKRLQN